MVDDGDEQGGYYRYPAVEGDRVVFLSEDDFWEVSLEGGRAQRLTSSPGRIWDPRFSTDGSRLAYTGTEEGATEVFVMDADGGPSEQLTYNGESVRVLGWTPEGDRILFRSSFREPFRGAPKLYSVPADGGEVRREELGTVHGISFETDGPGRVLGRHKHDLARWKRYRGGRAGTLWIDPEAEGDWSQLMPDETAGLVRPMWVDGRIYFISDMEGYGNLYSCTPEGDDLERHTDHTKFYARFAETDGETVVYSRGGDLHRIDVGSGESKPIEVEYPSPRTPLNRKFVDASEYLESYRLHPAGHSLAVTTRGKLFNFGNWEGAVRQNGTRQGVRYRMPRYLDEERLLAVSDEGGEPSLEIFPAEGGTEGEAVELDETDWGRPVSLEVSPEEDAVAFANNRHELFHVDIETGAVTQLDRSDEKPISGVEWSPDGRWVAYACPTGPRTSAIRIAEPETGEVHDVTTGKFRDVGPVFDPEGRYLYFRSCREFNPVYDQVFFELSFPRTMKPCVVTLTADEPSPFFEEPRPLQGTSGAPSDGDGGEDADEETDGDDEGADGPDETVDADADEADAGDSDERVPEGDADGEEDPDGEDDDEGDEDEPVEIDFEGIQSRIEAFPVREAEYRGMDATEDRVFWTVHRIEGSLGSHWSDDDERGGTLEYFSLDKQEKKTFAEKVESFGIGPDGATMALESRGRLRVVDATGRGPSNSSDGSSRTSRETGWIDSSRISVAVQPRREWEQMLHEAWRLMRDHYWREDMGGVDWEAVWERYSELLDRVATRSEFSDLIWIMQGELGTSHAYEMGGDYEYPPQYRPGYLGVDAFWDGDVSYERGGEEWSGGYRIDHIVDGASWEDGATSPLRRPGLDIEEGDVIVAVNGERLDGREPLQKSLVHQSGQEVEVGIADGEGEVEHVTVELLDSEREARYREWVQTNRERVHEASDGELGYIHIPDMGPKGYSEFHRAFASEQNRTGLVVDVRYNGGGHVSQLILERLARETIGYDRDRWRNPSPYPSGSMPGPMVALTNEYAGSDGDIFSHCFKLMELGPVLGKRTWGGVVGIWPRHRLVDGSVTTQPEFASWFEDVGYDLENYGTEPDEVVDNPPGSTVGDRDPQLDAAIDRALQMLEEDPPGRPDLEPDEDLAPPEELD